MPLAPLPAVALGASDAAQLHKLKNVCQGAKVLSKNSGYQIGSVCHTSHAFRDDADAKLDRKR